MNAVLSCYFIITTVCLLCTFTIISSVVLLGIVFRGLFFISILLLYGITLAFARLIKGLLLLGSDVLWFSPFWLFGFLYFFQSFSSIWPINCFLITLINNVAVQLNYIFLSGFIKVLYIFLVLSMVFSFKIFDIISLISLLNLFTIALSSSIETYEFKLI
jgi:hypothetical protein